MFIRLKIFHQAPQWEREHCIHLLSRPSLHVYLVSDRILTMSPGYGSGWDNQHVACASLDSDEYKFLLTNPTALCL